jgi:tetratricopeptide (TPR) repeat protein
LSFYDSTFFIKLLPRLKQASKDITFNERKRIAETMHQVWKMYFSIGESYDLPYEIAGFFYDLGFYNEALDYFQFAESLHGQKADIIYNLALSYYQLRQDKAFFDTIIRGKEAYPNNKIFTDLEQLDVS